MAIAQATKATTDQIEDFLSQNSNWELKNEKLHRQYQFKDFVEAFAFMTKIADVAEEMNHHPEWFNVYNKLVVDLTTHDANGISALDFKMAETMEALFNS